MTSGKASETVTWLLPGRGPRWLKDRSEKETFRCLLFDAFCILSHMNKLLTQKEETDKSKTKKKTKKKEREENLTYCDLHKWEFFSHKKKPKVNAYWRLVQLLSDASWTRFFLFFRTSILRGLAFYVHSCFFMLVRWLHSSGIMSSNKHPPNEKGQGKPKTFS